MSHELTIKDGQAHAIYRNRPAWHGLGEVFTEELTRPEAMKRSHLDFEVEVVPDYIRVPTVDGGDFFYRESKTGRKVLRTDTREELGTVGVGYTAVQNEAAFRVLDPLLDTGFAKIEAAISLRGGADAVLVVQFDLERFGPDVQEVFGGELLSYGLIANNHNGRRGILGQVLPFRVECANLLGMAEARAARDETLGRAFTLKHTANVETALVDAAEALFGNIAKRYELVSRQYRLLRQVILTEQEFREIVEKLVAPDPRKNPQFNPEARTAELVVSRYEKKSNELRRLWDEGAGHRGDRSAWEAYNGAVELIDHNKELFPGRGGSWRQASVLFGTYDALKQDVLVRVLKHAEKTHSDLVTFA